MSEANAGNANAGDVSKRPILKLNLDRIMMGSSIMRVDNGTQTKNSSLVVRPDTLYQSPTREIMGSMTHRLMAADEVVEIKGSVTGVSK
jgi:uncharacterized iron-regulated protein